MPKKPKDMNKYSENELETITKDVFGSWIFEDKYHKAMWQIVALIKKPEVTEEWKDVKAKELITMVADLYPYGGNPCVIPKNKAEDFIHSLVKEIQGVA